MELSWAHDFQLLAGDGSPIQLQEWVAPAIDEPERVADVRRRLRAAGADLDWVPAGLPPSWPSPLAADLLESWLNGVAYRWKVAEALLFRDELVIARSLRSGQERLWDALALYAGRRGPGGATITRVRALLKQPVEAIARDHADNRRVRWSAVRHARLRRRLGGWTLSLQLTDGEVLKLRNGVTSPTKAAVADAVRPLLGDRLHA